MNLGRRTLFFLGVMVTCLLLVPATPAEFRWVNYAMAGLALFWAIAVGIEDISIRREVARRDRARAVGERAQPPSGDAEAPWGPTQPPPGA